MRPVADVQPAAEIDSLCRQRIDLLEQGRGMDDHAVADDAVDPLAQNPGRHQRELVSHAVVNDRVPRVRAPLVAHDHVVLVAEQVDNLSLGLIAPLEAHDATSNPRHSAPIRTATDSLSLGIVKLQVNAGNLRRQLRQGIPAATGKSSIQRRICRVFYECGESV